MEAMKRMWNRIVSAFAAAPAPAHGEQKTEPQPGRPLHAAEAHRRPEDHAHKTHGGFRH